MTGQAEFIAAVRSYWSVRTSQGVTGLGEGSGADVRGGRHFDELQQLVAQPFLEAGFLPNQLKTGRRATLPGYYRPTKDWDLVVTDGDTLVAAFELKSLGGPSFGNNFNNRAEEAIGNASDLWKAYEVGSLGRVRPWAGYFFLIEDHPRSRTPVRNTVGAGSIAAELRGLTYCERAENLCGRLLQDQLYDAVCFATSSRDPNEIPNEPNNEMTWSAFLRSINARLDYLGSAGAGTL